MKPAHTAKLIYMQACVAPSSEHLVAAAAAAHDQLMDTEQALMSRTQSNIYEQPEVLQQLHALAELTSPEPDKVLGLCLWSSSPTHAG